MVEFDRFIFVDWSGGVNTKPGANSIWVASCKSHCENKDSFNNLTKKFQEEGNNEKLWEDFMEAPSVVNTVERRDTLNFLEGLLKKCHHNNSKTLIGFDFCFGYPYRAYNNDIIGKEWKNLWSNYNQMFLNKEDDEGKNRFALASDWNCKHELCFWGKSPQSKSDDKNLPERSVGVARRICSLGCFRATERYVEWANPKSPWQLYGLGSVGSQTLLGIPYVEELRKHLGEEDVKVWPFETKFGKELNDFKTLICEFYCGAIPKVMQRVDDKFKCLKNQNEKRLKTDYPKDRMQVEEMCRFFASQEDDCIKKILSVDGACVSNDDKIIAQTKEGWILGVPLCLQPCDRPHKTCLPS